MSMAEWLDTREAKTLDWQVFAEALVAAGGWRR